MTSNTSSTVIAFFGATGGCAANTLVKALQGGYRAVALQRKPSKLTDLLKAEPYSVAQSTLDEKLTIYEGSATDINAVKAMFAKEPIDIIVFGLGSLPSGFQLNLAEPVKMQQPTVCADSINTVITALQDTQKENPSFKKPFLVAISTTGVVGALGKVNVEDVPLLMAPLYHWMLAVPHKDKNNMETAVATEGLKVDSVLSGWSIIRPTLLSDGKPKGVDNIKYGWQNQAKEGPGPAKGYQIARADVGVFIFEKYIKSGFAEWNGRVVTLTN